jgi:hypothetical protein
LTRTANARCLGVFRTPASFKLVAFPCSPGPFQPGSYRRHPWRRQPYARRPLRQPDCQRPLHREPFQAVHHRCSKRRQLISITCRTVIRGHRPTARRSKWHALLKRATRGAALCPRAEATRELARLGLSANVLRTFEVGSLEPADLARRLAASATLGFRAVARRAQHVFGRATSQNAARPRCCALRCVPSWLHPTRTVGACLSALRSVAAARNHSGKALLPAPVYRGSLG